MVIAEDHVLGVTGEVLADVDGVMHSALGGGVGVEILDAPVLRAEDFEELVATESQVVVKTDALDFTFSG